MIIKSNIIHSRVSNKNIVLRNTYFLLGFSLLFSAIAASLSVILRLPAPGLLLSMIGSYGLLFAIQINATSRLGIFLVFLFTSFMGYMLGPLINMLLHSTVGTNILISALFGTSVSFIGLSSYVLVTKKDFSYLNAFVFLSLMGCLVASAVSLIFSLPLLSLLVSFAMTVVSSATIMIKTSEIIEGGETNYILATVSLFVSIYNIFVNLIQILMAFSSNSRD